MTLLAAELTLNSPWRDGCGYGVCACLCGGADGGGRMATWGWEWVQREDLFADRGVTLLLNPLSTGIALHHHARRSTSSHEAVHIVTRGGPHRHTRRSTSSHEAVQFVTRGGPHRHTRQSTSSHEAVHIITRGGPHHHTRRSTSSHEAVHIVTRGGPHRHMRRPTSSHKAVHNCPHRHTKHSTTVHIVT